MIGTEKTYKLLSQKKFNMLICDESHALKSLESNRSVYVKNMAAKVKRCLMLSGTPMFARPIELCTQLFSLRPDIFPSEMEFQNRYCDPKLIQFGKRHIKEYKGSTNQDELKWFLDK